MHTINGNERNHENVPSARKQRQLRPPTEKICIYCKLLKAASEYHSHQYITRTGRISIRLVSGCKACDRARIKAHRQANAEHYRATAKKWKQDNRERINKAQRVRRADDPLKHRDLHLRRKYGITIDEFNDMAAKQNGLCACCHRAPQLLKRKGAILHVDHCHKTGIVRGLLCHQCNVIIGLAQDNPITLQNLAEYLEH